MNRTVKHTSWLEPASSLAYALIIALLPIHAFISTWGGTTIGPLLVWKSWKEILIALLILPLVLYCVARPAIFHQLWARPYNKLILAYLALHIVLAVFTNTPTEAVIAGLLMNLRFFAIFIMAQIIAGSHHPLAARLKTLIPAWLLWVAVLLALLAIMQVTLLPSDFLARFGYHPGNTIAPFTLLDDTQGALRAFATMRGPNTLGSYLLIPLAFALYNLIHRHRPRLSLVALILTSIAILLTGSRSAWLGALATIAALVLLTLPRRQVIKWTKIAILPTLLITVLLLWSAINVSSIRLAVFHSSPSDPHLFEGSTQNHIEATAAGLAHLARHPIGTGPGSAGPASFYSPHPNLSENYYVQIGQEVGLLGLILFIIISLQLGRQLLRQKSHALLASFIGISLIGMFLHSWADDPTAMTWWGIAGLFIAPTPQPRHNVGNNDPAKL